MTVLQSLHVFFLARFTIQGVACHAIGDEELRLETNWEGTHDDCGCGYGYGWSFEKKRPGGLSIEINRSCGLSLTIATKDDECCC
jgi:hypothetical protein